MYVPNDVTLEKAWYHTLINQYEPVIIKQKYFKVIT